MIKRTTAALVTMLAMLGGQTFASDSASYAGEAFRGTTSLSKAQVEGLLDGRGMGYGRAAELNGYPGPAHVLELGDELSLSADQRNETEAIFFRMQAAARDLGADLVTAERALDEAFKSREIDESALSKLAENIGNIEARLRAVHLAAHLQQARVLEDEQISRYMELRGHNSATPGRPHKHHHGQ